jgi:Holliday junction resolvase
VKEWEKEERRLARRRGGVRQPGSGSSWRRRNDVREGTVLWEQKTTANRQFTIKEDDWENLRVHALTEGLIPALHITLGKRKRRLVLIEEGDFDQGHPPERPATSERHVSD